MPLVATYMPNGIFYNGSENNDDGSVTMTREFPIPFQRNRFCNPLGRLLGPDGRTVKWLRRETGCDIVVHTNDVRFLKVDSKVTIKAKDDPSRVRAKMDYAIERVLAIINPNDPGNTYMSDYQLFHPEDPDNRAWVPSNFNSANSGPTPPQNIAPGVAAPSSKDQPSTSSVSQVAPRLTASGSSASFSTGNSSGSIRQPFAFSATPPAVFPSASNFAPNFGPGFGTTVYSYPNTLYSLDPWANLQTVQASAMAAFGQGQRPQVFFHSPNLSRNYF